MIFWIITGLIALLLFCFLVEKNRRISHPVTGGLHRDITLPHQAEVELYSNAFSHCSRKTRLALAELGIVYQHHQIDLIETGWYQTISPAYLKINPSGLVPTLLHQGHPVYESDDILLYAQTLAGPDAPKLVPDNPEQRAEMKKWIDFCSLDSDDPFADAEKRAGACIPQLTLPMFITAIRYIPLRRIIIGFLFHPDKKRPALFTAAKLSGLKLVSKDPAAALIAPAREHMPRHLATINQALIGSGGPWLLGEDYGLADVTIGCVLLRLDETGWFNHFSEQQDLKAVLDYFGCLKKRKAWKAAIDDEAHPIVEQAHEDLRRAVSDDPNVYAMIYR